MKDNDTIGGRKTLQDIELEGRPETAGQTLSGAATEGGEGRVVLGGRYRVVRRLGEGGMGSVWLAEDLKLDGRLVALKMLPAVLANKKGAYRQVKQEALMAMKLAHPNIATVRAFEEEEGGSPFLVMDYINGTGLDDILAEKGKLSEAETLKLLGPVAAALDYAHSQGVVHRDVKPGNVMVRRDGTPFVLDFGIAREIQETMTRVTGKFSSGTLLYMSPEQLRGRAPKAAQDVYSFAAMAYECLAGHPPFYRGGVEDQIKNEPPEELEESVASEALRGGVMAGLAKEPEKRPGLCVGVLGNGGASRPGEPEKGTLITTTARPEGSPHHHGATGQGGDGDVFLRKVRVGKALEAAGREDATAGETAKLERVREVFAAGEEALKAGDRAAAGALFGKAEETLRGWLTALASRRKEEEERKRTEAEALREKAGETRSILLPGGATMKMVWCPPGSFLMGSPSREIGRSEDEIQHRVTLTEGFWMAKYAVTQKQWENVMGDNPSNFRGDNLPVERVSWDDCQEFCQKAGNGLRLPTEAEWEYACRAGSAGAYGGTGQLKEMGWYGALFIGHTHPVGEKKPNAWGLYDMHGNAWEWCADWYDSGYYAKSLGVDPQGPASGVSRVLRGGSYWNAPQYCRAASRGRLGPGGRGRDCGFRPVACQD